MICVSDSNGEFFINTQIICMSHHHTFFHVNASNLNLVCRFIYAPQCPNPGVATSILDPATFGVPCYDPPNSAQWRPDSLTNKWIIYTQCVHFENIW